MENETKQALIRELVEREITGAVDTLRNMERIKAILDGRFPPPGKKVVVPPGMGPQPTLPVGWELYKGSKA